MTKIKLTDNLSLSQIIRGFWRLDTWELSTDELIDNMKSSIDLGVTSFDTAEIYSDTLCESQIGEAFAKDPALRGKVELISKTGIYKQEINGESFGYYNTTYDRIVRSCKESLQRLHTDYLDLYLIHREDPLLDPWEAGRAMLDLKKEGLIDSSLVLIAQKYFYGSSLKAGSYRLNSNMTGKMILDVLSGAAVDTEEAS